MCFVSTSFLRVQACHWSTHVDDLHSSEPTASFSNQSKDLEILLSLFHLGSFCELPLYALLNIVSIHSYIGPMVSDCSQGCLGIWWINCFGAWIVGLSITWPTEQRQPFAASLYMRCCASRAHQIWVVFFVFFGRQGWSWKRCCIDRHIVNRPRFKLGVCLWYLSCHWE